MSSLAQMDEQRIRKELFVALVEKNQMISSVFS